jgi:hypothetical protein
LDAVVVGGGLGEHDLSVEVIVARARGGLDAILDPRDHLAHAFGDVIPVVDRADEVVEAGLSGMFDVFLPTVSTAPRKSLTVTNRSIVEVASMSERVSSRSAPA